MFEEVPAETTCGTLVSTAFFQSLPSKYVLPALSIAVLPFTVYPKSANALCATVAFQYASLPALKLYLCDANLSIAPSLKISSLTPSTINFFKASW